MSTARSEILGTIRRSLHRDRLAEPTIRSLDRQLADPRPNVVPARGRGNHGELVERFAAMVVETQASLERVAGEADCLAAIALWLDAQGLGRDMVAAPALEGLDWQAAGLRPRFDAARAGDLISVTPALSGVAETGTLVVSSGPDHPTTLNFLPDVHVVILRAAHIVGAYEDAWMALRAAGPLPRTVTFITGPSRTADIEQSLLLGAHGPRRLHVVLVDDA